VVIGKKISSTSGQKQGGEIPVYGSGSVEKGYFNRRVLGYLKNEALFPNPPVFVEDKDVLLAVVGSKKILGRAGLYSGERGALNTSLARVRLRHRQISPYFLAAYFNTEIFRNQLFLICRGTKNNFLNGDDLKETRIFLLTKNLVGHYAGSYRSLTAKIGKLEKAIVDDGRWAKECLKKILF